MPTKKAFDSWIFALNLEIDNYSAIVAVGGDGTYHEVVNGVLFREDKKKIPFGFIPNGSANDTNSSFGCLNIETAIDYIIKGDTIKMDIVKIMLDHEKEEDITLDNKHNLMRYGFLSFVFGLPAKVVKTALRFKYKYSCCNPYMVAAFFEFLKCKTDLFGI